MNERVFPYLGLPRIIHSDNGREFVNRVIREVVKDWGGEDVLFVNGRPRHSQSQGLVEQGNATIERHIANKRATLELANDYPWASWLPKIQYNMNTEVAGGTKKTPYEVVFGQPPRTNIIPGAQGNDGVVNEEDLPFELNPDSASNNHDDITAQDEDTHTQSANDPLLRQIQDDTTIRDEREIPPTEEHLATDEPRPEDTDNDTAARGEEDVLPYIERPKPTPKPRKRRLESPAMTDPAIVTSTKQQDEEEQLPQDAADQRLPSQTCVPLEGCQDSTEHAQSLAADQRLPSETCVPLEGCQESTEQSANVCSTSTSNNPTAKHFKVRQEADANYRANAEKMKLKYSKRKRVINETFTEGDLVTVRVPKIDRSSTDQPRLVAKVVKTRGTVDKWYQLQCKFGILDGWYRTGELMPYGGICSISFDNDTKVTLREAARKENPNMIQRKKCMCQGPCSKNCYCVKNSMMCTSHCHPSKTCRNVEKAQFPEISLLDRKMVNDGQELSDKHTLAAQQLLKKQFPSNNGLNDTVTLASRSTPEPTPYVQIMHVNGNHWLTIAASNQKGPVEVFDSLKPAKLTASTLQSIKKFHGQTCLVKLMNNQKQEGFKDCGLFAIANATSLCFGDDPTFLLFEQQQMREHLLVCIEKGEMTPFPHDVSEVKRKKRVRTTQSL